MFSAEHRHSEVPTPHTHLLGWAPWGTALVGRLGKLCKRPHRHSDVYSRAATHLIDSKIKSMCILASAFLCLRE